MNGSYKVSIDVSCLDVLLGSSRRQRLELSQFFDSLADNPFQIGNYQERSPSGRIYYVKSCRPFAVTFWADHAVKEVRIVGLRKFSI